MNPPSARVLRALSVAVGVLALGSAVAAFAFGPAAPEDGAKAPERIDTGDRSLDADQTEVRGTITRVVGSQVSGPSLSVPLTLTVARGGGTKATITGGAVAGKPQVVAWDGGRPLLLSGTGRLDLAGPADVEVTSGATTWALDGAARALEPGSYILGATVAVGSGGLASPRDGVTLVVADRASVATKGGVTVALPATDITLNGPGGLLLEGDLLVRSAGGTTQAGSLRFGPGPFELALARLPDGRGYAITKSLLQGVVAAAG